MGNIQEKIGAFLPEAVFEEGQYLTVSVPADKLNALCRFLHDDKDVAIRQFGIFDWNGLG